MSPALFTLLRTRGVADLTFDTAGSVIAIVLSQKYGKSNRNSNSFATQITNGQQWKHGSWSQSSEIRSDGVLQ